MSTQSDQMAFQKAQEMIGSGQPEHAIKLLRDIKPKSALYPHAMYALGTLYMQQNAFEMAENTFLRLLKMFPDHADSWRNLGLTRYYGLHQPLAAVDAFVKALEFGADAGKIKTYLGLIALHMNDPERAYVLFNEALELYPSDPLLLNSKGQACLLLHRFDEAKTCVLKTLELTPDSAAAAYNALLLSDVLPADEGMALKAELSETSKAQEIALVLKAQKAEEIGDVEGALALYEQATSESAQLMTRVAFAKARLLHKKGDIDGAWEAFVKANALERSLPPSIYLDVKTYPQELRKLVKAAKTDWADAIRAYRECADPDGLFSPVFIVGFPRSGTTLTGSILNAHPDILVTDECAALNDVIEHMVGVMGLSYPEDLPRLDREQRETLRHIYWEEHQKHPSWHAAKVFCDKFPLNIVHLGLIATLFPTAKIIYLQRHPADSVLSAFMQDFQPNAAMIHTQDIADCAALYMLVREAYSAQQNALNFPVHTLHYEDIVDDFDVEIAATLTYLGLPWDDAVRDFNRIEEKGEARTLTPSRKQVRRHLYTSAINRWKRYESHLKSVLPVLLKEAKKMGYEDV